MEQWTDSKFEVLIWNLPWLAFLLLKVGRVTPFFSRTRPIRPEESALSKVISFFSVNHRVIFQCFSQREGKSCSGERWFSLNQRESNDYLLPPYFHCAEERRYFFISVAIQSRTARVKRRSLMDYPLISEEKVSPRDPRMNAGEKKRHFPADSSIWIEQIDYFVLDYRWWWRWHSGPSVKLTWWKG